MKLNQNVILGGLVESVTDIRTNFQSVIRRLIGPKWDLHEVRVNGQIGMFKGKIYEDNAMKVIMDDNARKVIMDANKLNGMDGCKSIIIQRHLTFKQRKELFRKRGLLWTM